LNLSPTELASVTKVVITIYAYAVRIFYLSQILNKGKKRQAT